MMIATTGNRTNRNCPCAGRMPFIRRIGPAILGITLLTGGSSGIAAESDADRDRTIAEWQQKLEKVESISSDFVQEKRLALFSEPVAIRGHLFIHRDGRFAWEIHWPIRYKLVVAGDRIRQWDEETGKVKTIVMRDNPAAAGIHEQMSAWFSGRYLSLTNSYRIELLRKEPPSLRFMPIESSPVAGYLTSLQIELRADGCYMERIRIEERSGDSMDIAFTNTELNLALPPETWEMGISTPASATNSPPGLSGTGKGPP